MKSSKKIMGESSLILIISTALVKIIGACFKIPLATDTFLGDIGFGYYSVAHDLYMPFYVLAISGLPAAIAKMTADYISCKKLNELKQNLLLSRRLFLIFGAVISGIVTLCSIPLTLTDILSKNTLYSVLAIVPSIFLCFLISVYRGYFEGKSNMYPTAISKIIEAVIKLVFGLIFAYIVMQKTNNPAFASAAAMTAITIGTLISTVYLHIKFKNNLLKNTVSPLYGTHKNALTLKTLLALALPFALASLSSSLISFIDVFTVKTQISSDNGLFILSLFDIEKTISLNEVSTFLYGIRSKAFTLYYLIPTITMSIGIGALPILAKCYSQNDIKAVNSNSIYILKLINCITIPASFGLFTLSQSIMELVYSSGDKLNSYMLCIYGVAALFTGIAVPLTTVLQSINLQKKCLIHIGVGFCIKILSSILFVKITFINIFAAPISSVLCYLYITVSLLILFKKHIGTIDFINSILKPLICSILCCAAAYFITEFSDSKIFTLLSILCGVVIYLLTLILFKTFSKSELSQLPLFGKLFEQKKA